ncbi:MAG: histidinol-phosphate transaminase [Acidimicrobiia bacterium]
MTGPGLPSARDDIAALSGYFSPQLDVPVRLNTNESPVPPPDEFVEEWCDALRTIPLNRYPDRRAGELRAALADRLGVRAEQVFCGNGSNEVLQSLLLAYGGAGRRAVTFEPTYALHSHIATITGTEVVAGKRRADFSVDPDAAATFVEEQRPSVIFLCSPNNPTGTLDPPGLVGRLRGAAPGALVVVDEAYGEFAQRSEIPNVTDDAAVVVVRTYSKVWSLAALRLGFCVAPAPVVRNLDAVALPYNLSAATQAAGLLALRHGDEMAERVAILCGERDRLVRTLRDLGSLTVYDSGANFLLIRPDVDAHSLWERLLGHGVLVRDFTSRPGLDGTLRITVGTPDENDALLAALPVAIEEVAA